jgi:hypothetical protein
MGGAQNSMVIEMKEKSEERGQGGKVQTYSLRQVLNSATRFDFFSLSYGLTTHPLVIQTIYGVATLVLYAGKWNIGDFLHSAS